MKGSNLKGKYRGLLLMVPAFLIALAGYSQERKLPDGSIVYEDGSRRLPNGTIIYKDGSTSNGNGGRIITLPNGTIAYPDDRPRRNIYKKKQNNTSGWLPPGQAKKIYGGSAKDYAPGQQKKWKGAGKGHKN